MAYEPPTIIPGDQRDELEEINPWIFIEPLLKNFWAVLLIIVICVCGGIVYNLYATPIYRATSTIIVRRFQPSGVIREREAEMPDIRTSLFDFNTYIKIITSNAFAEKLAARMVEQGHFQSVLKARGYENLKEEEKRKLLRGLGKSLMAGVDVDNPKMTNIITISAENPDPALCRDIVNNLAQLMVEYGREETALLMKNSMKYLEQQLEEARKNVEAAESKLFEYKMKKKIIESEGDKELIQSLRFQLLDRLEAHEEKRKELEARIRELDSILSRKDFARYTAVNTDDQVQMDLSSMLVKAEIEYNKLLARYGRKHPDVIKAEHEIEVLRRQFEETLKRTRLRLQYELEVVKAKEKALRESLADVETEAIAGSEKDIEYAVLEREANSARDLYKNLLAAYKEVSVNANSNASNTIILHEKAVTPTVPVKPKKKVNLLVSFALGVVLATAFAFGRDYLDQNIRLPEDVKKAVKLPVLSSVPLYSPKSDESEGKYGIYVSRHPKSLFSESITALRTHINIKLPQESSVAILITSSAPREGKTIISSNLAASMALDGKKTVLVDGDLHRPSVHKAFGKDKHNGLFDLIVDDLNPRWSDLDFSKMSLGDINHLARLKQWSGTVKVMWDSLPDPLTISYKEGKLIGSNIKEWKEKFSRENGFPAPQNPEVSLEPEEIADLDSSRESALQVLEFMEQYPRLKSSRFLSQVVLDKYLRDTEVPNLYLLTAGTNPKNPNEILGSQQMKILLTLLKERFDRVIIDCPPAWPLSDVSVLAPIIDAILFVCRVGEIPKPMFTRVVQQIQAVQPQILGVVLNAVDLKKDRYYYYGGYAYYYYYRYYKSDYYRYIAYSEDGSGVPYYRPGSSSDRKS